MCKLKHTCIICKNPFEAEDGSCWVCPKCISDAAVGRKIREEEALSNSPFPCPFCSAPSNKIEIRGPSGSRYFADCTVCGAEGPSANDKKAAIRAWNTRPGITDLEVK